MAFDGICIDWSFEAGGDLSAKQYYGVTLNSSGQVAVAGVSDEAEQPIGVLQDKPDTAGHVAQVRLLGITKASIGSGGVTAGDLLATEADGQFVTASGVTTRVVGIALETAAAGTTGTILFCGAGGFASQS